MENITALSLFQNGLSKAAIKDMAAATVHSVSESGNTLQVAEALAAMEAYIKEIKATESFKDYVREEAVKFGKVYTSPSGAKIEIAETGTKYDYSQCNDIVLVAMNSSLAELQEKIKDRESFVKVLPTEGIELIDEVTGEVYRVFPPSKTSTSSYKVTLAK